MIWFGKIFIKFCKSFINLIKLFSTRTCSSARVRRDDEIFIQSPDRRYLAMKGKPLRLETTSVNERICSTL